MANVVMQAARRRSIQANLFPAALAAVEPWDDFRWHGAAGETSDAYKEKSSQALTIDLFGSLKLHARRDAVFDRLAGILGLATGGPWEVALEWHDPANTLAEKQPTWVDAVARSPRSLIFFECKFCEADGGACTQTRPIAAGRRAGLVQCNGHYLPQTNPANGRQANCALTAKGVRYWDLIPEIFGYAKEANYAPCPFAGAWFQWMRNLATCVAVARRDGLQPAFVVVYADWPGLPMAERVGAAEWRWLESRVDPAAISFRTLSFQALAALACQAVPDDPLWPELTAWIERKISSVGGVNENLQGD
jgi:hypothetical protein